MLVRNGFRARDFVAPRNDEVRAWAPPFMSCRSRRDVDAHQILAIAAHGTANSAAIGPDESWLALTRILFPGMIARCFHAHG